MNTSRKPNTLRWLLFVVVAVQVIFGLLYALNVPRWEAPDEPAQFNYIRHIAETWTLPVLEPGDYDQAYLEKIKAERFPPTLSIDSIRYESYGPPLYYLLAAPVYLSARTAGLDPVTGLRLFSVMLGALLLLLSYRVFVQVFPARPFLAVAAVGFMATLPMHVAMSAAINADTFAEVLVVVLLFVSLARGRGELSDRRFMLLGGIVYGLVLLTSIKIYASGILLVMADLSFRKWRLTAEAWRVLLPLFAVSLVMTFWWFSRNALLYGGGDIFGLARHDAIVTGQPTTVEWVAQYGLKNVAGDFFFITFKSFWAQFGWMGVLVNDRIYVGLFVLTCLAILGALLRALRMARERGWRPGMGIWVWVFLGVWLLVALADHTLYNLHYFQPQGRYLFPALVPIAAVGVAGLDEIFDKRYTSVVFIILYAAMVGLDYVSLYWYIIPQLRI